MYSKKADHLKNKSQETPSRYNELLGNKFYNPDDETLLDALLLFRLSYEDLKNLQDAINKFNKEGIKFQKLENPEINLAKIKEILQKIGKLPFYKEARRASAIPGTNKPNRFREEFETKTDDEIHTLLDTEIDEYLSNTSLNQFHRIRHNQSGDFAAAYYIVWMLLRILLNIEIPEKQNVPVVRIKFDKKNPNILETQEYIEAYEVHNLTLYEKDAPSLYPPASNNEPSLIITTNRIASLDVKAQKITEKFTLDIYATDSISKEAYYAIMFNLLKESDDPFLSEVQKIIFENNLDLANLQLKIRSLRDGKIDIENFEHFFETKRIQEQYVILGLMTPFTRVNPFKYTLQTAYDEMKDTNFVATGLTISTCEANESGDLDLYKISIDLSKIKSEHHPILTKILRNKEFESIEIKNGNIIEGDLENSFSMRSCIKILEIINANETKAGLINSFIELLPNLELLIIGKSNLKELKISNEKLKALEIYQCSELKSISIDTTSLTGLNIRNCKTFETFTISSRPNKIDIANCPNLTEKSLQDIFRKFNKEEIEKLELTLPQHIPDYEIKQRVPSFIGSNINRLEAFDITNNPICNNSIDILLFHLAKKPLKRLSLVNCNLNNKTCFAIKDNLKNHKYLELVDISNNKNVTIVGTVSIYMITNSIHVINSNLHTSTEALIENVTLHEDGMIALARFINRNSIKTIALMDNDITDDQCEKFRKNLIQVGGKLTTIEISGKQKITSKGAIEILTIPTLTEVNLKILSASEKDINKIKDLSQNLQKLDLNIADGITLAIAKVLLSIPALQPLNLEFCKLSDQDCIELKNLKPHNQKIIGINISNNRNVTFDGAKAIVSLPSLKKAILDNISYLEITQVIALLDQIANLSNFNLSLEGSCDSNIDKNFIQGRIESNKRQRLFLIEEIKIFYGLKERELLTMKEDKKVIDIPLPKTADEKLEILLNEILGFKKRKVVFITKDSNGDTALDIVARQGDLKVGKALIEAMNELKIFSSTRYGDIGTRALQIARENNHNDFAILLENCLKQKNNVLTDFWKTKTENRKTLLTNNPIRPTAPKPSDARNLAKMF